MNEERQLAAKQGKESPIHDSIEETHRCYNENLDLIIQNLRPVDRLFVGSHNADSIELAKKLLVKYAKNDGRVRFGQLKGFSD